MARDKSLPFRPVVGDRIRLKAERITAYKEASALAGYEIDPYAVRTVIRIDPFASGGGERLHVEGAPHMFLPRDVALAWNTEDERRGMLLAHGWTHDEKTSTWKAPRS